MNRVNFKPTRHGRLALSLVLVCLGVAAAQPGHAEVVVTQTGPVIVSGNWVFLDSRRKEIERIIQERLDAGALSSADSIRLRVLLDPFKLDFNRAIALGYSLNTALPLAARLDAISGDLVTYARVSPFQNLVYLDPASGSRTIRLVSTTTTTTPVVVSREPIKVSSPVLVSTPVAVASDKVVSITTIEPRVIRDSIRVRHDRMAELISAGLASGNLTAAQASIFRKQLDDLAALQAGFDRGGTITYANYLPIAYQYDLLRSQLVSVVKSPTITVTPLIQNGRLYLSADQVVAFDDMMKRRAGLESKISYNLMMGRLSESKAAELRSRLQRIASLEGNYKNSGGRMNDEEAKKLYTEFDKVGSALDHAIHM